MIQIETLIDDARDNPSKQHYGKNYIVTILEPFVSSSKNGSKDASAVEPGKIRGIVMFTNFVRKMISGLILWIGLMLIATQVEAHAKLVRADPAKNSNGGAPTVIQLHFSETLELKFSRFKLTDIKGTQIVLVPAPAKDDQTLAASPGTPLAPGRYTVSWTAVAADDGHKTTGTYSFTVQ
jgi:copper resistance protein C